MGLENRTLGRTGLKVYPLGLGSSYGLGERGVEEAFDRGVNYFYWGTLRRGGFGRGLRNVCKKNRDRAVVCVQSYTRLGFLMGCSVRRALRKLEVDHADVLLLGWWNKQPPARIRDAAQALKEKGVVRHLGISTHNRKLVPELAAPDSPYDVFHVRYNAAHRGAETEIFPLLGQERPGLVAFTATRWGTLLARPKGWPEDRPIPSAADCYRFAVAKPEVDVVLSGPRTDAELIETLNAFEKGPLENQDLAWIREFGDVVYGRKKVLMEAI